MVRQDCFHCTKISWIEQTNRREWPVFIVKMNWWIFLPFEFIISFDAGILRTNVSQYRWISASMDEAMLRRFPEASLRNFCRSKEQWWYFYEWSSALDTAYNSDYSSKDAMKRIESNWAKVDWWKRATCIFDRAICVAEQSFLRRFYLKWDHSWSHRDLLSIMYSRHHRSHFCPAHPRRDDSTVHKDLLKERL